jgi:hypothetical protein
VLGTHDAKERLEAKTNRKNESLKAIHEANFKLSYDEEIQPDSDYVINP